MVQVKGARQRTFPSALGTVMADGKPHEQIEVDLAAESDIKPMKLLSPCGVAATTWDYAVATSAITTPCDLAVSEIPADYPGRDMYDRTTAYAASDKNVPVFPLKVGDVFNVLTAVDCTSLDEGKMFTIGSDDIVAVDNTPDALTSSGHALKLRYAVSTTEVVLEYCGIMTFDIAP